MSSKKNMKSKQQSMVENSTDAKVTPVVEATPVESKQKGGRAKKATPVEAKVEPTPVEAKVEPTPVEAKVEPTPVEAKVEPTPVAEKKQRGGRKKAQAQAQAQASVPATTEAKVAKPRATRAKASTNGPNESKASDNSKVVKPKVSRKKKSDTVSASDASSVSSSVPALADEDSNDKHIRSFKVKLPGSETFEGRFTGLTPYQAANKALSKYFREGERTDNDVTFSICESTRKSKKSVYTYVGKRHKLEVPVKYSIQDGREIVKNFKNTLKKVKKSEGVTATPSTETSVSMGVSA
jgi:hypothetical protein